MGLEDYAIRWSRAVERQTGAHGLHALAESCFIRSGRDEWFHTNGDVLRTASGFGRTFGDSREHHSTNIARSADRMWPNAVGDLTGNLTDIRIDGGDLDRDVGMLDWRWG